MFESACLELIDFGTAVQQVVTTVPAGLTPVNEIKTPSTIEVKQEPSREQTEIEKIWGNVLLKVKENNMFALSNALTNIVKVNQIGNKIILTSNDLGSYEMIDNKDRISVLLKLINLFDDSIQDVIVEYDRSNASKQDIKDNLRDAFKSKIKFKE